MVTRIYPAIPLGSAQIETPNSFLTIWHSQNKSVTLCCRHLFTAKIAILNFKWIIDYVNLCYNI